MFIGHHLFNWSHNLAVIAESLSPSRRRSLFTLATSMILFSSKAFNIIPLIYCTKVVLTEKMVCVSLLIKLHLHWFTLNTSVQHLLEAFIFKCGLCFLLSQTNDFFWLLSRALWHITMNFMFLTQSHACIRLIHICA